jgi:hypothetical protein
MAREKPLDVTVVQAWLAAWDESDLFSEAAIHHFQSFIADPHCLVVLTLRVGREPRSLVFRRVKRVVEAHQEPSASNRPKIVFDTVVSPRFTWRDWAHSLSLASSMFVSPVPPVAPPIGQLWHQTGVESETVPKLERVLRWDGADWVAAGYVSDSPIVTKQGKQACDFQEALASAHRHTEWIDCQFIYTYDGSTCGNA